MPQAQAKKLACTGRLVLKKIRWSPLVGGDKIQPSITVNIGDSNSAADQRFNHAELRGDVVVPPVGPPHEEGIAIMATKVGSRFEAGPQARVVNDLVVTGPERLKFGPAINCAFNKPTGLHR